MVAGGCFNSIKFFDGRIMMLLLISLLLISALTTAVSWAVVYLYLGQTGNNIVSGNNKFFEIIKLSLPPTPGRFWNSRYPFCNCYHVKGYI